MYQFFVDPSQIDIPDRCVIIMGEDVNHIRNVLRMRPGEEISVRDGRDGREYRCGILSLGESEIVCELRFIKEDAVELSAEIYLFQGLPKGDKMEFIIQKAVELGVHQVIPVAASRCVVKLDGKKAAAKRARWQGIAEAAAKQSKRAVIPEVTEVSSFARAVGMASGMDVALIPYELAEDMSRTKSLLEGIRPGQRRKGYARETLRLTLDKCREAGEAQVLITCDKDNIPSARTILANGGVLENEVADEPGLGQSNVIQRYWITLTKS